MSKIQETTNKMKKKMSFNDYEKPDLQPLAGKDAIQQTNIPASHNAVMQEESNSVIADENPKNKVTFYLDEDTQDKLEEIIYQRKRQRRKQTKSALVCEAINMLYKQEVN
jgi:hypothetical protein